MTEQTEIGIHNDIFKITSTTPENWNIDNEMNTMDTIGTDKEATQVHSGDTRNSTSYTLTESDTTEEHRIYFCCQIIDKFEEKVSVLFSKNKSWITRLGYVILGLLYMAYVAYSLWFRFGDEGSIRLLVVTIFGFTLVALKLIKNLKCAKNISPFNPTNSTSKKIAIVQNILRM